MRLFPHTKHTRSSILKLILIDVVLFCLTAYTFQLNPYLSLVLSLIMLVLTIYILKNLKSTLQKTKKHTKNTQ